VLEETPMTLDLRVEEWAGEGLREVRPRDRMDVVSIAPAVDDQVETPQAVDDLSQAQRSGELQELGGPWNGRRSDEGSDLVHPGRSFEQAQQAKELRLGAVTEA
jgi:hypothetical protein